MKHYPSFIVAVILALDWLCTSSTATLAKDVTLTAVAKPLRLVAEDIATQTQTDVVIDKNVGERKLICIVRGVPEEALLRKIAHVLGAQVTIKTTGAKPQYTLALKPEVAAWSPAYTRAREDALRSAIADTADMLFAQIQKELPKVSAQTDAGKLSHMMPEQAWHAVANAYAGGMDGLFLTIDRPFRALYTREFSELSSDEQETVRQILDKLPPNYGDAMRKDVTKTYVAVSLSSGTNPAMGIGRHTKDSRAGSGYPYNLPFNLGYPGNERTARRKYHLNQWLRKHPVPAASVLDFSVTSLEAPELAMRIPKETDDLPPLPPPPADGLTRTELLTRLSQNPKLNLVSDYYTDSRLVTDASRDVRETLPRAAHAFECVWEQQSNWLLCRQADWAEKDVSEAPYPIFERVFALRYPQAGTDSSAVPSPDNRPFEPEPKNESFLPLDLLLQVCSLPHEQFKRLAFYTRKDGLPAFYDLTQLLAQDNSATLGYRKYGLLSAVDLDKLASSAGIVFADCPAGTYEELNDDAGVRAQLQAPIPSDARVRLKYYPPSNSDGAPLPGWHLELLCGSPPGIIQIDTSQVPAAPPKAAPTPSTK